MSDFETPNRLDRIEVLAIRNTEAIAALTTKIDNLTDIPLLRNKAGGRRQKAEGKKI